MLVGDYCPRALDPIYEVIDADREIEIAREGYKAYTKAAVSEKLLYNHGYTQEHETELPCNVFGTVDRCDGMACEHDGNCFSGCCSVFVQGESQRCMPLVGGDLCPIAIDVVEAPEEAHEEYQHEYDSPLHYVDHKELGFEDELGGTAAHHDE